MVDEAKDSPNNSADAAPQPDPKWNLRMQIFGSALGGVLIIWALSSYITDRNIFWQVLIGGSVSWLILIAMAFQTHVFQRQWKAMRKQARITEKALELSENTFYIAERAYLGLANMQVPAFLKASPVKFRFDVQNRGRTPAFNVRIAIQQMSVTLEPNQAPRNPDLVLKEMSKLRWSESMTSHLILPGEHSTANSREQEPFGDELYELWNACRLEHWIGVQVKFTDIRGLERFVVFLNVVSPEGPSLVKCFSGDVANIISKPPQPQPT